MVNLMPTEDPAIVYWFDNRLYVNATNRCSNDCWFCFRNYKKGVGNFNLKLEKEPTSDEIEKALEKVLLLRHWKEIVFCGFGEPTAKLDVILHVSSWIRTRQTSLPIRLDTNGHGYALNKGRDVAEELKSAGFNHVSVSLNGYDDKTYNENCRPRVDNAFETTVGFIRKAKEVGLEVEISVVRMPEVDVEKVKEISDRLKVPLRIRDYVPCFW